MVISMLAAGLRLATTGCIRKASRELPWVRGVLGGFSWTRDMSEGGGKTAAGAGEPVVRTEEQPKKEAQKNAELAKYQEKMAEQKAQTTGEGSKGKEKEPAAKRSFTYDVPTPPGEKKDLWMCDSHERMADEAKPKPKKQKQYHVAADTVAVGLESKGNTLYLDKDKNISKVHVMGEEEHLMLWDRVVQEQRDIMHQITKQEKALIDIICVISEGGRFVGFEAHGAQTEPSDSDPDQDEAEFEPAVVPPFGREDEQRLKLHAENYAMSLSDIKKFGFYNAYGKELVKNLFRIMFYGVANFRCYISTSMGPGQPGHSVFSLVHPDGRTAETESTTDVSVLHTGRRSIIIVCEVKRDNESPATKQIRKQTLSLWKENQRYSLSILFMGHKVHVYEYLRDKTSSITVRDRGVFSLFHEIRDLCCCMVDSLKEHDVYSSE